MYKLGLYSSVEYQTKWISIEWNCIVNVLGVGIGPAQITLNGKMTKVKRQIDTVNSIWIEGNVSLSIWMLSIYDKAHTYHTHTQHMYKIQLVGVVASGFTYSLCEFHPEFLKVIGTRNPWQIYTLIQKSQQPILPVHFVSTTIHCISFSCWCDTVFRVTSAIRFVIW